MAVSPDLEVDLQRAAEAVCSADALVFTAGAGMGVDSGLPDFRGREGFWNAYPPYAKLGLEFAELANPRWFRDDPALAWGFYGHRLNLYRDTTPHAGFAIWNRWAERVSRAPGRGAFVITSNVDGHFQRAGFDPERVVEVHGTIEWAQCLEGCGRAPFRADDARPIIDESTMRAQPPWPTCPDCGAMARPNILMFGDIDWIGDRTVQQEIRLGAWLVGLEGAGARITVIECGAGKAVPTIRRASESLVARVGATLVRVNVRDHDFPSSLPAGRVIGLPLAALEALRAIDRRIGA